MSGTKQTILEPEADWANGWFQPGLVAGKAYSLDAGETTSLKLDQNESPWDWPDHLKDRILQKLKSRSWNRYPDPFAADMHRLVADHAGVPAANLITTPGSNLLISLIFDALAGLPAGKMHIARPSFSLFESHCRFSGIDYQPWLLTDKYTYDCAALGDLTPGSVVLFASPNNPTGTCLPSAEFRDLLAAHPRTLFIADEAYYEFSDDPYTPLLGEFSNLLILRTLSKTMGAAGIRLGYGIGSAAMITMLAKRRLPYLLNHFTVEAVSLMLTDAEMKEFVQRNIDNAIRERQRLAAALAPLGARGGFTVFPSGANFLLMRWADGEACRTVYRRLMDDGVQLRDISGGPGLAGCLRVSTGTPEENDRFLAALGRHL